MQHLQIPHENNNRKIIVVLASCGKLQQNLFRKRVKPEQVVTEEHIKKLYSYRSTNAYIEWYTFLQFDEKEQQNFNRQRSFGG